MCRVLRSGGAVDTAYPHGGMEPTNTVLIGHSHLYYWAVFVAPYPMQGYAALALKQSGSPSKLSNVH
jgi:hypothetical protein